MVKQLAMTQKSVSASLTVPVSAQLCGICSSTDHHTDGCPTLQETEVAGGLPQAYVANIYNNRPPQQQNFDPNRYHPSWRNHPNFRWGNDATSSSSSYQAPLLQQINPSTPPQSGPSLEELMKQMAVNTMQFQQRTEASIKTLETQVGQLASSINQMQSQGSDKLPAQTVVNPNVCAISLRSGKVVDVPSPMNKNQIQQPPNQKSVKEAEVSIKHDQVAAESSVSSKNAATEKESDISIPLPFPQKMQQPKEIVDLDREILETFSKVEVNIPLLEAIKQIPRYAKFLKELCTQKRKMKGIHQIGKSNTVLALLQPEMPEKCKDPGTFTIPCTIGNYRFDHALIDLGAAINVMPHSVYASLKVGPLKPTNLCIQLADGSPASIGGMIEDVLIKVDNLVFPADFYVVHTRNNKFSLILGRSFLKTAKTKIDVAEGTLSMEFGDNIMHFKIYDSMKETLSSASVHSIDLIHPHTSMHVTSTASFDPIASHTCTTCDDGTCSICVEIATSLHDSALDSKLKCEVCTDSVMCSICAEIENYLHRHVANSENLVDDSVVTSTRLECTTLIIESTFLSNFVDEQLEKYSDIDSILQAFIAIDVSVDSFTCIDCVDGVCSACAEINTAIANPPPIPNAVINYVEEVGSNDDLIVYGLDDHQIDMDVIHRAFVDHEEMVEHDPIHQLTIVQTLEETPPPKPPDLEIDLSNILNHDMLIFYDISGFDVILRPVPTQIIVPQEYELSLSARQPPDPH